MIWVILLNQFRPNNITSGVNNKSAGITRVTPAAPEIFP